MGQAQNPRVQRYITNNAVLTAAEVEADARCEAWKQAQRDKARIALFERVAHQNRFAAFDRLRSTDVQLHV